MRLTFAARGMSRAETAKTVPPQALLPFESEATPSSDSATAALRALLEAQGERHLASMLPER